MNGRRGADLPSGIAIAASVLDSDLADLGDEVRRAVDAGVDRIHLDVMDAHFVPNLTFGWRTIDHLRAVTDLPFDAHLMISEPGRWTDEFIDAGCDSIAFHVEVDVPQVQPALQRIREAGRLAGLSVKPGTPLDSLAAYRDLLDVVLVMTVEPGFGGQSFMVEVARAKLGPAHHFLAAEGARQVHVDGGGNRGSAGAIGEGGTDVMVVGSALYRADDMADELRLIRAEADPALARYRAQRLARGVA